MTLTSRAICAQQRQPQEHVAVETRAIQQLLFGDPEQRGKPGEHAGGQHVRFVPDHVGLRVAPAEDAEDTARVRERREGLLSALRAHKKLP